MATPDHVLIVDDDAEIRTLLSQYLQRNGYRASAVADGKGMWADLDVKKPDIIVLDLMLPGDDGLTLCRDLRARSSARTSIVRRSRRPGRLRCSALHARSIPCRLTATAQALPRQSFRQRRQVRKVRPRAD